MTGGDDGSGDGNGVCDDCIQIQLLEYPIPPPRALLVCHENPDVIFEQMIWWFETTGFTTNSDTRSYQNQYECHTLVCDDNDAGTFDR